MLLVQAGASGSRPRLEPSPTASACARIFTIGFVADVAGLRSSVDAAGWRGVGDALRQATCGHADLALPTRPSDYSRMLQTFADRHLDLVIAASFLLTDPVVAVARANPATHFLLVDPLVNPPEVPNLAVLVFRSDQAAFLAGALAGMVTRTGVVAGVYGPEGLADKNNRLGFEHGARYVRAGVRVLGAYQPAGAAPYANPVWGADQARAFSSQRADVIFGAGGTTGQGALLGAAQSGVACIAADDDASSAPGCLLASTFKLVDRGVRMTVADAIAGRWRAGLHSMGLAEGAVGLSPVTRRLQPEQLQQVQTIADLLAAGQLGTGA